jgi:hypothetical protein
MVILVTPAIFSSFYFCTLQKTYSLYPCIFWAVRKKDLIKALYKNTNDEKTHL